MIDTTEQTIRGVPYTVEAGRTIKQGDTIIVKKRPRYIVQGVMHPAGVLPIRFKSLEGAERHMRNMGIGK